MHQRLTCVQTIELDLIVLGIIDWNVCLLEHRNPAVSRLVCVILEEVCDCSPRKLSETEKFCESL